MRRALGDGFNAKLIELFDKETSAWAISHHLAKFYIALLLLVQKWTAQFECLIGDQFVVPHVGFAVNLRRAKMQLEVAERLSNMGHCAILGLQECLGGRQVLGQEALMKLARRQDSEPEDEQVQEIVKKLLAVAAERHLLFGTKLPSLDEMPATGGKSKE